MKAQKFFVGVILVAGVFVNGCSKDKDDHKSEDGKGKMEMHCINPMAPTLKQLPSELKSVSANPALTGDITETIMLTLKFGIGDVWVSKGEVKDGLPDNLEWIRLTNTTNTGLKRFEEYSFPAIELEAGEYKSIKITLRNVFYRICQLKSDPSVIYELLETMGGSSDPCNPEDESWTAANYFGPDGNFILGNEGVFRLISPGEKIGGFTIRPEKLAKLYWRLGAGVTEPCTNYLMDINNNGQWDCGIDELNIECPPTIKYMWDFVVEYE